MQSSKKTKTKLGSKTLNLSKLKIESEILEEELGNGLLLVDKVQKDRARILKEIEDEYAYQEELRTKINFLKSEYTELVTAQKKNEVILAKIKKDNREIEKNVSQAQASRRKVENKNIIRNSFPALVDEIKAKKAFPRESSILLNCFQRLIETTLENEFSGVNWKSVIDNTDKTLGGRILFEKLSMQENDVKSLYAPLLKEIESRFGRSSLSVQTNVKSTQGIVYSLDFRIQVPIQIRQRQLDLP